MPVPIPWQLLLPLHSSEEDSPPVRPAPLPDPDNSEFTGISDERERSLRIAQALSAGVEGANPKQLAVSILAWYRHDDA